LRELARNESSTRSAAIEDKQNAVRAKGKGYDETSQNVESENPPLLYPFIENKDNV
jgi:hypothetical protein